MTASAALGRTGEARRSGRRSAKVGQVLNGVSLAVLALTGLVNGLNTDGGVSVWRVALYPTLALLLYLHGRWLHTRGGGLILGAVALLNVPLSIIVSDEALPYSLWETLSGYISLAVVVALPWLAAHSRRQQAQLVLAGRRELAQLKREREYVADNARARERARIATDVHDSLGHELALIALRAGALELSAELSEPNRRAAAELRSSAVAATDRLRETIGMLREDAVPVEPADENVTALVERAVAAGMTVTLERTPEAAEQLPPLVDRAVHRVVREALTNAARHAPGAAVTVALARSEATLTATITNPGSGAPASRAGTGSGLAGLAERVRLLGGDFTAGPTADGFTVSAALPVEEN